MFLSFSTMFNFYIESMRKFFFIFDCQSLRRSNHSLFIFMTSKYSPLNKFFSNPPFYIHILFYKSLFFIFATWYVIFKYCVTNVEDINVENRILEETHSQVIKVGDSRPRGHVFESPLLRLFNWIKAQISRKL